MRRDWLKPCPPTISTTASAPRSGGEQFLTRLRSPADQPQRDHHFNLYGPNDAMCGNSRAVLSTSPSMATACTLGSLHSDAPGSYHFRGQLVATQIMGAVSWQLRRCNASVVVTKVTPNISTTAYPASRGGNTNSDTGHPFRAV